MVDTIEGMMPAMEAASGYPDIREIWVVEPENKDKAEELIKNLEEMSLWTVKSDDLMTYGPSGLYLFDNPDLANNPFGGFDTEEGKEVPTNYRFGVLDSNKVEFAEMKPEEGYMLCVIKNEDDKGVFLRLPIEQIAKINPIEIESLAAFEEYMADIKKFGENRPTEGTNEINKYDLEAGRKVYGMWNYVAKYNALKELDKGMVDVYGEIPVSSDSLRSVEEFLADKKNWENLGVGLVEWKADRVFVATAEMIKNYDGDFNASVDKVVEGEEITVLEKICDLAVRISEKVGDDLLFWRMLQPVMQELEIKRVSKKEFLDKLARSGLALINFFDLSEVKEIMKS